MKRLPLIAQFTVVLFLLLAVPFAALSWYATNTIMVYSREEVATTAESTLEANRHTAENILTNVVNNVQRLVRTFDFTSFQNMQDYKESISGDPLTGGKLARDLQKELANMTLFEDAILSAFFYVDDSDYIISSDRGVMPKNSYSDIGWMTQLSFPDEGVSGIWYPHILNTATVAELAIKPGSGREHKVISYAYRLNKLTTSANGTIVINLSMNSLAQYMNPGGDSEEYTALSSTFVINERGAYVAHLDNSLFLENARTVGFVNQILERREQSGYDYFTSGGEEVLYTYSRAPNEGWIYISLFTVSDYSNKSADLMLNVVLLTFVMVIGVAIVAVVLLTLVSRPVRKLAKEFRSDTSLAKEIKSVNEMEILAEAFGRVQQREVELREILREREKDSARLAVRKLLIGEIDREDRMEVLREVFPHSLFLVILMAYDRYPEYKHKTNTEMRLYQRYLLENEAENILEPLVNIKATRYAEDRIALILNFPEDKRNQMNKKLEPLLREIGAKGLELTSHTFTIGVGEVGYEFEGVHTSVLQAAEALQNRVIKGSNTILYWNQLSTNTGKYIYIPNSEQHLLNYLHSGNLEAIEQELWQIKERIEAAKGVSHDNVEFIYNQLLGITLQFLAQHNVSTAQILGNRGNVYATLTSLDTLEDITKYLLSFYREVLEYVGEDKVAETNHLDKVLQYLEEHFREDIIFEDMAGELEISYSYMRKLVKDATGKSMMDYLNSLRITEAKRLLTEQDTPVNQVAQQVGYRNVQSLNRFFKKYEGVTPSEYKASKTVAN